MIVLYHCVSARSFRPLWMLEELGLPYELKMLPFPPRQLARSYLEVNPLGTIPLLIDGNTRILEARFTPAVAAYWTRLQAREAYRRALLAQEGAAREQGVSTASAAVG